MIFSSIIMPLLFASTASAMPACNDIPGWDKVLAKKEVRYIVLGEMHGTNEMPEIFADAVCLTSQKRKTVVALEMPETDQPQIDAWLASDGGSDAKQALLATPFWSDAFKDGRTSEAMFRLLDQLRSMHKMGRIKAAIAFQPVNIKNPMGSEDYEKGMAKLIAAKKPKAATVLVLVGNVHAMRTEFGRPGFRYLPMAGHLPKVQTLSFDIMSDGVSSLWACMGPADKCGSNTFGNESIKNQRGVTLSGKAGEPYDGMVFLGESTTASFPQTTSAKFP
jgi:hypothetical protein